VEGTKEGGVWMAGIMEKEEEYGINVEEEEEE